MAILELIYLGMDAIFIPNQFVNPSNMDFGRMKICISLSFYLNLTTTNLIHEIKTTRK